MLCEIWRRFRPVFGFCVLGAAALGIAASPAHGQSEADLRRENQRLVTQAKDLQAELDAAKKRISDLEKQIADLRATAATSGGTTPGTTVAPLEEEKVTIDETVPNASPRAFFNYLGGAYKEAIAATPMGEADSRERTAYLRTVEGWVARMNREQRTNVSWTVVVNPTRFRRTREGLVLEDVRAIDPVTKAELGSPFPIIVPRNLIARVEQSLASSPTSALALNGVLEPSIGVNDGREAAGVFNNPRLIGPFAEFGFSVRVRSLQPAMMGLATPSPDPTTTPTK